MSFFGSGQRCDGSTQKGAICSEFRGLKPTVIRGVIRYYCWRHIGNLGVATPEQVVEAMERTFKLPHQDGTLVNVHPASACEGEGCAIHHPSDHHMKDWPLVWRGDGPFDIWVGFERQCPHGIGHLDPDTEAFMRKTGQSLPVHGCDGCCREPDSPGLAQLAYREPLIKRRRTLRERLTNMLDRLLYVP